MKLVNCFAVGALALSAILAVGKPCTAQNNKEAKAMLPVMRATGPSVKMAFDGVSGNVEWVVKPEANPDILTTRAAKVTFYSDVDTLTVCPDVWDSMDFVILTAKGDSAHVRVNREASNPYENPNPRLLKRASSGKLSPEQAQFDLKALFYNISEIHPDIFSVARQEDLMRAFNKAVLSVTDSVTTEELYKIAAPVVAMIGDGHTAVYYPSKDVYKEGSKRLPLWMKVLSDRSVIVDRSLDSLLPKGSKILKINGKTTDELIDELLPFMSGESENYRLSRLYQNFRVFLPMILPAEEYNVDFLAPSETATRTATIPMLTVAEYKGRVPADEKKAGNDEPYTFSIDEENKVGIMDFSSCEDAEMMERFAKEMFNELKEKGIKDLIIDVRLNGGGSSSVGDVLLRYISPIPCVQMEKCLIRVTPTTLRWMPGAEIDPGMYYFEMSEDEYIKPHTAEEGFYNGRVWLLTSPKTFSSANSFAWTFQQAGCGKLVGETTGGMNVAYGDIASFHLPISGLKAGSSCKRFWQFKADENDIHGTIPDYKVPSEQAMDKVLELISKSR